MQLTRRPALKLLAALVAAGAFFVFKAPLG